MAFEREDRWAGRDGEAVAGHVELRRDQRGDGVVARGTLACPSCDAPVSPGRPVGMGETLACPYCARIGPVRDFLSLASPQRATRVVVRIIGTRVDIRRRG